MGKRLAALLVLAAGTALSGCVAAVIPAIAGTTILGKRVLDKEGKEAAPEQASASTPAPAPVPESGPDVAVAPASDASDPPSQPELSLPERIPGFATRPALADLPAPAPAIPPAPAQNPPPAAAYPDPDLPLTPGQASFARFVRYTQSSARQAAQGAELPSAMLSDAVSLDGKRRRCSVGEQLVAVIDLDPAGGIFAPPATTEKGDVVLDPFFGTGTTGAVAKRLGREWIGCEREDFYREVATKRIDRELPLDESALTTMQSPRTAPKVAFGAVVEAGLIPPGAQVFDRKRRFIATVRTDGSLECQGKTGSIHGLGKEVQGAPSCNGWAFWHYEKGGEVQPIDAARQLYLLAAED